MKNVSLVALAGMIAMAGTSFSSQVLAQTAAALPTPPTFGAAIPGQCVIDTAKAMAGSNLGKSASDRLVQLKAQVDAELSAEGEAIETEAKTLQDTQKTATATAGAAKTAWENKAQAWNKKSEAFQRKVQMRNSEMQYTQQIAMQAVFEKMIPQINAVVTQKQCSTVVQSDSLLHYETSGPNNQSVSFTYVNPQMDITSAVVQKLNSSGEQLPAFDRVNLEQQAQAQGAAPKK